MKATKQEWAWRSGAGVEEGGWGSAGEKRRERGT